jgi:hemerythrin-like domain-containing protein
MKPIEDLKAEHKGIVLILSVLEKISERIAAGESVPIDHLKQVLSFLQIFTNKCHHGKEEGLLFAAMEEAGVPKDGGPLGGMLSDHVKCRQSIGEMKELLNSCEKGGPDSQAALATAALQFVHMGKNHIWKENIVLFPMAEKSVPADKLKSLGEQFERFKKEETDQGTYEAFHAMIEELARIYL